jgi:hypothetical protein
MATLQGHCLPGLTARQSQLVRALTRTALAERGLEAIVYADHLETADGRTFGLTTLGSLCRRSGLGQHAWPGVVNRYIDDLFSQLPSPPPPLTPDQIRAGVHLRLVCMPPEMSDGFTYARDLGGGFREMLVHKDGDFVRWINDAELATVDADEMRDLGLRRLLEIRPDEVQVVAGKGAEVYCVRGESGFIASKLLVLEDLMRIVGGGRLRWPDGVLVAVPSRHEIVFAPIDDAVADNLAGIATLTSYDHAHDHAPVSPYVYWWNEGRLVPLFDAAAPGLDIAQIPAEFWELWERHDRGRWDSIDGEDVA